MYYTEIKSDVPVRDPRIVDNIDKTIKAIAESRNFDMSDWTTCAAAHAVRACTKYRISGLDTHEIVRTATKVLGLSSEQARNLFHYTASRIRIIDALITLRDTGHL